MTTPTKLHVIRCLTDVARNYPGQATKIFSILFKMTVLDSDLSYEEGRSLLFELDLDLDVICFIIPSLTESGIREYLKNFRDTLELREELGP